MPKGNYNGDRKNPIQRFVKKYDVDELSGCWVWNTRTTPNGYAKFRTKGKDKQAHRWAYEFYIGPIPEGMQLDHLCRVRNCVSPYHLEPVTQQENILRGEGVAAVNAKKTHCLNGHEFTVDSVYQRNDNKRNCIQCARGRKRKAI